MDRELKVLWALVIVLGLIALGVVVLSLLGYPIPRGVFGS